MEGRSEGPSYNGNLTGAPSVGRSFRPSNYNKDYRLNGLNSLQKKVWPLDPCSLRVSYGSISQNSVHDGIHKLVEALNDKGTTSRSIWYSIDDFLEDISRASE